MRLLRRPGIASRRRGSTCWEKKYKVSVENDSEVKRNRDKMTVRRTQKYEARASGGLKRTSGGWCHWHGPHWPVRRHHPNGPGRTLLTRSRRRGSDRGSGLGGKCMSKSQGKGERRQGEEKKQKGSIKRVRSDGGETHRQQNKHAHRHTPGREVDTDRDSSPAEEAEQSRAASDSLELGMRPTESQGRWDKRTVRERRAISGKADSNERRQGTKLLVALLPGDNPAGDMLPGH
jgi:hypothetical protein